MLLSIPDGGSTTPAQKVEKYESTKSSSIKNVDLNTIVEYLSRPYQNRVAPAPQHW